MTSSKASGQPDRVQGAEQFSDLAGAGWDRKTNHSLSDRQLDSIARWLVAIVASVSLSVLVVGWGLGQMDVATFGQGFSAMVPSTAALLLMVACALLANLSGTQRQGPRPMSGKVVALAGVIVVAVASANIFIGAVGLATGIDQLLAPDLSSLGAAKMSEATSLSFVLLGVALLSKHAPRIQMIAATIGLTMAILAQIVFAFDARTLSHAAMFSTMSLPTAVAFACLFTALLIGVRETGWVAVLLSPETGSRALRRLLPGVLFLPFGLDYLTSLAIRQSVLEANFHIALLALATTLVLLAVLIRDAKRTNKMARQHADAMQRLELAEAREKEVELERERAQMLVDAKSRFLANMSHEIRTPMNGILGFSELLLEEPMPPKQAERVRLIHDSGQSMLKLLNAILDLSKIEAGHMEIKMEEVNIHNVVRGCLQLFEAAAAAKGLCMTISIDDDVPKRVMCDGLRVRQVLSNLIGNAVKFTDRGQIGVHLRCEMGSLVFCVEDSGIGIDEEALDTVLDEFVQADDTVRRRFGGSGLGLNISNKLVGLMDGELSLKSQPDQGTVVTVRLPLVMKGPVPILAKQAAPATLPKRASRWAGYRVAVAEDHPVNQQLIVEMLGKLGIDPTVFEDGAQAITGIIAAEEEGQGFDAVLMDIQMPGVDGLTTSRELRNSRLSAEHLPIIAMTANVFDSDIKECLDAGMQDHLGKPISSKRLEAVLAKWLPETGRLAQAV